MKNGGKKRIGAAVPPSAHGSCLITYLAERHSLEAEGVDGAQVEQRLRRHLTGLVRRLRSIPRGVRHQPCLYGQRRPDEWEERGHHQRHLPTLVN